VKEKTSAPTTRTEFDPGFARNSDRAAGWALFTLGLLAPLESRLAGFWAGGMWVSAFEGLIAAVAVVAAFAVWTRFTRGGSQQARIVGVARSPVAIALLCWALVHVASAFWSNGQALMSLKFGLRMSGGVLLALLVMLLGDDERLRRRLVQGLLGGLAVISVLAVLERALGQQMEPMLKVFRDEPTWMLGEQRLSAVFYHANTFAAYLELATPLVLVTAAGSSLSRARRLPWLAWLLLCGAMLSLTYSRAGLLAGVLGAAALAWSSRRAGQQRQFRIAASFALLLVLAFGANPDMRARLGVGAREYKVDYKVHGGCYAVGGHTVEVVLELHNRGNWPLSNRQAPGELAWTLWDGGELPKKGAFQFISLPPLKPDARIDIPVRITLPKRAGRYTALFDIRRKNVLWLSSIGNELGRMPCISRRRGEPLLAADLNFSGHTGISSLRKRRIELSRKHYWQAAARLLNEKPLLGHGADRFRLEHARLVPAGAWDSRARSHSVVIETAANLGILGLLMLGLLIGTVAPVLWRNLSRLQGTDPLVVAATIAVCGFGLHSLVDYFLAYTKILAVVWPLLGLALCGNQHQPRPNGTPR
jgi:hypothetical protein